MGGMRSRKPWRPRLQLLTGGGGTALQAPHHRHPCSLAPPPSRAAMRRARGCLRPCVRACTCASCCTKLCRACGSAPNRWGCGPSLDCSRSRGPVLGSVAAAARRGRGSGAARARRAVHKIAALLRLGDPLERHARAQPVPNTCAAHSALLPLAMPFFSLHRTWTPHTSASCVLPPSSMPCAPAPASARRRRAAAAVMTTRAPGVPWGLTPASTATLRRPRPRACLRCALGKAGCKGSEGRPSSARGIAAEPLWHRGHCAQVEHICSPSASHQRLQSQ